MPAGTAATELQNFIRLESVPVKVQAAGALASISDADGMVVVSRPGRGRAAHRRASSCRAEEYNALQARIGRGGGTVSVPEGLLEITIPLDPVRTVGGTVRPGDLVGLIASLQRRCRRRGRSVPHRPKDTQASCSTRSW